MAEALKTADQKDCGSSFCLAEKRCAVRAIESEVEIVLEQSAEVESWTNQLGELCRLV